MIREGRVMEKAGRVSQEEGRRRSFCVNRDTGRPGNSLLVFSMVLFHYRMGRCVCESNVCG
jgi:hypothetical protein